MSQTKNSSQILILLAGDIVSLILVTVIGFASHGEVAAAGSRMLTTFIPLAVAWFMAAPFFGVYTPDKAADLRQLWRPVWAMIVAGPMAAWLRSVMLGLLNNQGLSTPILPLFVLVLGGFGALAVLIWRWIAAVFLMRKARADE